jgi:hypothetical protein
MVPPGVVEGYSARQLSVQSGHSPAKLYRIIDTFLDQPPPVSTQGLDRYQSIILDATFIHRPLSLIAVMDAQTNTILAGQYAVSENSEPQLVAFFKCLIAQGLRPYSFTVDGNPHVIKALRRLWPQVIIQRCLIHIQRQGLAWCRISPKSVSARKLRVLFLRVTNIHTPADRDNFLASAAEWEDHYGHQIAAKRETGWVFSDIKRARSMLLRALPDMFRYLEDPQISRSTNGLEGYFSRLKSHYRQHRGLAPAKLRQYFAWYFHFVPR